MNIQQLKYFIEITQTRNLSSAARNLFVTQPTLSLSIKKLESELNTSLFVHTDEPFQLTTSGAYLYKKGVDIVEQFDQLIEDIHQMNDRTEKKTNQDWFNDPILCTVYERNFNIFANASIHRFKYRSRWIT